MNLENMFKKNDKVIFFSFEFIDNKFKLENVNRVEINLLDMNDYQVIGVSEKFKNCIQTTYGSLVGKIK